MSEIRRDAAKDRKLCQSTTTGEWTNQPTGQKVSGFSCDVVIAACPGRNNVYSVPFGGQFPADDARFIAEAHQALPHWIDRAEKAEALLAKAIELFDDMCELCTEADVCDPEECNCTTMVRKIERMLSLPDPTKEVPSIPRTPSGMSYCPAERQQQYTPLTAEDYEDLHRMTTERGQRTMTAWRLSDSRVVFVSDGISDGRAWATYYRKSNGGLKRVVSKDLPPRHSKAEAQRDLDRWAGRKRWAMPVEVAM